MRLTLALPLRNQTELESFVQAVSDRSSPSYHRFLTVEQFTERFGPGQEDYNAVVNFALANGFTVVGTSRNRLNVDVEGPVSKIESAFHLRMNNYQHPTESRTFYAPDREPTLVLAVRLWHVTGLDNYSIPQPALSKRSAEQSNSVPNASTGSGPSASFLGSDMRAAYYGGTALTGSGQSLGLLEYRGVDLTDLNTYFQNVGQTYSVPITLLSTDGTSTSCLYSSACDDTEPILDLTQAIGMAPRLSNLVMYVGSSDASMLNAMATTEPLNAQLSISWLWTPADPVTDDPYFMEFAAQGQSVFAAAGDSGAWSSSTRYVFPADDPYVISVGGTDLESSSAAGPWSSESAWLDGGGGISPDNFPIPSWQTTAANGCALCSTAYRNGPDVAANANWSFYVCANQTTCSANQWGGTSFAAPMWAGYSALANEQSVAGGNAPIGFVNPAFYSIGGGPDYGTDFHDTTNGTNGLPVNAGYDLATGWGSPNGVALINDLAPPSTTPGFTLSVSPGPLSVTLGNSGTSTVTTAAINGFDSAITLSTSGQPAGVTVNLSSASIAAPGNGSSILSINVASTTAPGTYLITITGTAGGATRSTALSLIVPAPTFSVSVSPPYLYVGQGAVGSATITTAALNGFNSAITFSTCNPSIVGVSVAFTPSTIAAPGNGASTMTIAVGSNAGVGSDQICLQVGGVGLDQAMPYWLYVRKSPVITWPTLAAITYDTPLSAAQLDATANIPGSFTYSPAAGTILSAGTQTLSVTFTPTDTTNYTTATATVPLTVNKAMPTITWPAPASITYGTALSSAQLNAEANIPGSFTYSRSVGTVLSAGTYSLVVTFTPSDTTDYTGATASVLLTVNKAVPIISWPTPSPITYGTAMTAMQLDAGANVTGTFVYNPAAGTIPPVGTDTLTVTFTPTDSTDYTTASASVALVVNPAPSFALTASPSSISIKQGGNGTSAILVNAIGGFSGKVTLAASRLPKGVAATWSSNPATTMSTLTLSANGGAATGTSPVTITGTSGSLVWTITITLTVVHK
jgi:hypothetical protein